MLTYATPTNTVITLASLAHNAARESRVVDNNSTRYDDVQLSFWCQITGGVVKDAVYIYFYGANSANTFTTPATGTDAALTWIAGSTHALIGPGVLSIANTLTTMRTTIGSVGSFFGGNLPSQWGFVIYNFTTSAFTATEANHGHAYTGLYYVGT